MAKRLTVLAVVSLFVLGCVSIGLCDVAAPKSPKKQTTLKLYTDAKGAYKMFKEKKVPILDVRTPQELQFVGNTGIAVNIPWEVWSYKWDDKKGKFKKPINEKFVQQVKALYKPGQPLIIMCRSGHRSAAAINALAKVGYTKVYQVVDGFEGDKAKEGPNKGQRVVNGWKNAKLPWTYKMKKDQTYMPK